MLAVSVDGLRPEFYLDETRSTPNLQALRRRGAFARSVLSVFPSLTYPAHASLVTGLSPARHGIQSNTLFDFDRGPSQDWYWEASHFQTKPLWQLAEEHGRKSAVIRWPTSVGAQVSYLIPEIFTPTSFDFARDWRLLPERCAPQGFLSGLLRRTSELGENFVPGSMAEMDEFALRASLELWKTERPDLLLVHLANLDHVQHERGRESSQTRISLAHTDALLGTLISSVSLADTTLIVLGDHGFFDCTHWIQLNALFSEQGWLTYRDGNLVDWKAIAHCDSGQAAIYIKDPTSEGAIRDLLARHFSTQSKVVERVELDKLQTYPDAAFALEALPGFGFGSRFEGPVLDTSSETRGNHGQLPWHPEMHTGFIMIGQGVRPESDLGVIRILDVAPTIAHLLGFELPESEGRILEQGLVS